jgi:hypothetical protein
MTKNLKCPDDVRGALTTERQGDCFLRKRHQKQQRPLEVGVVVFWRPHGDSNPGYRRERFLYKPVRWVIS